MREVERGIVFEVASDAAQLSTRHNQRRAALPCIARIRRDKPVEEADNLAAVMALIANQ